MLKPLKIDLKEVLIELAKRTQLQFTKYTMPKNRDGSSKFFSGQFHKSYYSVLDKFYSGEIKKLMITVPPQHGKALEVSTPVLTSKGWKAHGDLKKGDYVYGEMGQKVKVLENHGAHNVLSSKVVFSGGEEIIASNNHDWKVWCDRGRKGPRSTEKIETQDLLFNQRRSPSIPSNVIIKNRAGHLPIDPYVLGCWLGDGSSRQGVLTVGQEDIEHFKSIGEAREVKPGIYRVLIPGLSRLLRINGLILNKHIPKEYMLGSLGQRLALLQGLMDTDGTVDKKGRCEFTQKTGVLGPQVYTLLRTLGIKPTINTYKAMLNGDQKGYKDRVLFKTSIPIFRLDRKIERLTRTREDANKFFIKQVLPVGPKIVNCITVEGGLYLAGPSLILTHNSEGSTRRLPARLIGKDSDLMIAIASYSSTQARRFGRDINRIIDSKEYLEIYPETRLSKSKLHDLKSDAIRTSEEFEIIDSTGEATGGNIKLVGRQTSITGNPVDILVIDDLYKDSSEGNSPTIRQNCIDWYNTTAESRLHNDSQQLIVFTRWHEEDLIGYLESKEEVRILNSLDEIEPDFDGWYKINYEAIKTGEPTELDPRKPGKALWPERHSLKKLKKTRSRDVETFECLYQGNPESSEGYLYKGFDTYDSLPAVHNGIYNYTDTADTGQDYLCSIDYAKGQDGYYYVVDILYTQEPMEVTEPWTINMLNKDKVSKADIESNNGGRGFARNVQKGATNTVVDWFHQSDNKESRIFSNSATVQEKVKFPSDWASRWPLFYKHLTRFKKVFKANDHDDAPDTVTGIVEVNAIEPSILDAL